MTAVRPVIVKDPFLPMQLLLRWRWAYFFSTTLYPKQRPLPPPQISFLRSIIRGVTGYRSAIISALRIRRMRASNIPSAFFPAGKSSCQCSCVVTMIQYIPSFVNVSSRSRNPFTAIAIYGASFGYGQQRQILCSLRIMSRLLSCSLSKWVPEFCIRKYFVDRPSLWSTILLYQLSLSV